MKNNFTFTLAILAFFSFSITAHAQKKIKIGKVSMDELKMSTYKPDSTAKAVILYEKRYYNIEYNNGFQLVVDVQRRIKILHKDAFNTWGNITFNLYENRGSHEVLGSFKGYTCNLIDGKVVVDKLTLRDAFKERRSEHITIRKFSFKNLQEGSVIDYAYKIYSDFFSRIPDLYFQYSIPVVWSELTFDAPEYYKYKYFVTGSEPVFKKESSGTTEQVGNFSFLKTRDYWAFKNVPALKQLSFMRPVRNYRTKVNYELYAISFPGSVYKNYSSSWEEINKDFLESDNFGYLLKKLGRTKKIAESLEIKDSTAIGKTLAAVNYVQTKYQWNGNYGVYPSLEWKKNIREEKGSAADINFTLIGILRNLDIEAYPVILSTRNNGTIFKHFPATEDFNYIITAIKLNGKFVLVDPTSEFTGLNILPEKCLNGDGLLIRKEGYKWVPIEVGLPYSISEFVNFKIDEDLNVTAEYQSKHSDYAAYYFRNLINKKGGEEKYIEDFIEDNKDDNISDYSFTNLEDLSKPIIEKYTAKPEEYLQEMGDLILMKPILFPNFDENPFKKDKRTFPIDFKYPQNYAHTVMIELPEGYVFDEVPKNLRIATPDRALYLTVIYSVSENKLTMQMKFKIAKTMLKAERYEEIKGFFDNVVNKENEQIVIREN